jgi:hypothetical protein
MKRGTIGIDQVILIGFFVLLIIFAIALLTGEAGNVKIDRPQLQEDLANQYTQAFLMSLLKTKAIDDARLGDTNFADIIIMNSDGKYDQFLMSTLPGTIPKDTYVSIRITYPTRFLHIGNIDDPMRGGGSLFSKSVKSYASTLLPGRDGNIEVSIELSTPEKFEKAGIRQPTLTTSFVRYEK